MSLPLSAKIAHSVQTAVRWLKLNESSVTDARDCAIAVSALIAAERSSHAITIQHFTRKLRESSMDGASWNEEVWDTVWATRALLDEKLPRAGISRARDVVASDPLIRAAVSFLVSIRDGVRGFWYGEPFETMIALDLLFLIEYEQFEEIAEAPVEWLLSLQTDDGRVIAPHFTGIFASVLRRIQLRSKPRLADAALAAAEWLAHDLDVNPIWTSASWSNAHALQGLLDNGYGVGHPAVVKAVEWFLAAQSVNGEWSHVATVDDTAMAVLALAPLLTTDLIDVTPPQKGTVTAIRTNGVVRLTFEGPAGPAVVLEEFVKFTDDVADDLRRNEMTVLMLAERLRGDSTPASTSHDRRKFREQIFEMGVFAHGHLFPAVLEKSIRDSHVDHLRLNVDERLIDLPWELIHDGEDYLCLKYAMGRQIYAATSFAENRPRKDEPRALVVSDPTGDLPDALSEGTAVVRLLSARGLTVTHLQGEDATKQRFAVELKRNDIIHFAGHASRDAANPDESCIMLADGPFKAFRLSGFFGQRPPALVFLNACWSASERSAERGYQSMMRGLGRTFVFAGVANFLGYLIPVSDRLATTLALHFYSHLVLGRSVGEALRRGRIELRDQYGDIDPIWASAVLYGDPATVPIRRLTPSL